MLKGLPFEGGDRLYAISRTDGPVRYDGAFISATTFDIIGAVPQIGRWISTPPGFEQLLRQWGAESGCECASPSEQ